MSENKEALGNIFSLFFSLILLSPLFSTSLGVEEEEEMSFRCLSTLS